MIGFHPPFKLVMLSEVPFKLIFIPDKFLLMVPYSWFSLTFIINADAFLTVSLTFVLNVAGA